MCAKRARKGGKVQKSPVRRCYLGFLLQKHFQGVQRRLKCLIIILLRAAKRSLVYFAVSFGFRSHEHSHKAKMGTAIHGQS